jgi:hypothetical protein
MVLRTLQHHEGSRWALRWPSPHQTTLDMIPRQLLLACPPGMRHSVDRQIPQTHHIELLWRHGRREVTHCELFERVQALLAAAADFFARYNQAPQQTLSIIGSKPAIVV